MSNAPPPIDPAAERRESLLRALRRYHGKLGRKLEALRGDLAEAERAPEWRRYGEALLAYANRVPARSASAAVPDPADASRTLEIPLDPNVTAPANAARYFKRAAKGERGQRDIPARIAAAEREVAALAKLLADAAAAQGEAAHGAMLELERALARLTPTVREQIHAPEPLPRKVLGLEVTPPARSGKSPTTAAPRGSRPELPARLQPRRLKTLEGWDVLIGRTNEGNDYLSHQLARPEDYWFHVHGAAGSHVVLRRGKGKNEPSRQTIEEVAAWTAFYSQARNAGKVPVIYTQKKYVRKARKGPPGLALVEREKSVMVRPAEPPKERLADAGEREVETQE